MYAVLFHNLKAIPMHRDELKNYDLTGHEAIHYFPTMEEAVEVSNQLNK